MKKVRKGIKIVRVEHGSPAFRGRIGAGDLLISVDGRPVRDEIDFRFLSDGDAVKVKVGSPNGDLREVPLRRRPGEGWGLELEPLRVRRCANRCIFCFYDQMPAGLRRSLYVKDDDYRLSFAHGNFITLTNMDEKDFRRIVEQRLGPLYISVHATEPELRRYILGNSRPADIMPRLRGLAEAGIRLNLQVVLCPGVNDGPHLERTVRDLLTLYPSLLSLAVVPVGLTRFRRGLHPLTPVTKAYAGGIVSLIGRWQGRMDRELGERIVHLSDEFYIKAGTEFPPLERYGDLHQLENGVGMVPLFLKEFYEAFTLFPRSEVLPGRYCLVTGMMARELMRWAAGRLNRTGGVEVQVKVVKNRFFGRRVTVSGLLTGRDIAEHLAREGGEGTVLIPSSALAEGEDLFLDGVSLRDLECGIGRPVRRIGTSGVELVKGVLGGSVGDYAPGSELSVSTIQRE